jgi:transposase InsO family protein
MRQLDLKGVVRGKDTRTTMLDKGAPCPADRVNWQFLALRPNLLWVSDFIYIATWQGFVYVAFVIDTFARRIVGWRVSRTAHAGFVRDAAQKMEVAEARPVATPVSICWGNPFRSARASSALIRAAARAGEAGESSAAVMEG